MRRNGFYLMVTEDNRDADALSISVGYIEIDRDSLSISILYDKRPKISLHLLYVYDQTDSITMMSSYINMSPLIIDDEADYIVRYRIDDLYNNDRFVSDINGFDTHETTVNKNKRIEHSYMPITKFISIIDDSRDIRLTIMTDRTEGGVSNSRGSIQLGLNRVNIGKDNLGMEQNLHEPYTISIHHTIIIDRIHDISYRHQQTILDNNILYIRCNNDSDNSIVYNRGSIDSMYNDRYIRYTIDTIHDRRILIRLYNMNEHEVYSIPDIRTYIHDMYSISIRYDMYVSSIDGLQTIDDAPIGRMDIHPLDILSIVIQLYDK